MPIIIPPFNPDQDTPNGSFFYPETWAVSGPSGPLIIGSGLDVSLDGILSATGGGGGGGVTSLTAGTGITLTPATITSTGTIGITPVGSAATVAYPASLTVNASGQVTAYTAGAQPLSNVVGGSGITVTTPSAGTRSVALSASGVTGGSYTNPTFTVNSFGIVTAASSGPVPVTNVSATAPVVSSGGATPNISLASSGVAAGAYTNSSVTVNAQGLVTAAASGPVPVTAVTGVAPIQSTGGPTPAISLANTAVTAGSYTYASLTVDPQGRLTAASDGVPPVTSVAVTAPVVNTGTATAPNIGVQIATAGQPGAVQVGTNLAVAAGVISVASASTTQAGIVQLNDSVASSSTTEALTAAQGLALQTQIDALSVTTNLTFAGTFDAAAGQMLTVTSGGTAGGFTVGSDIPAASAGLTDFFVIVTTGGSYSPPGGGGPYTTSQGDWFLCNGTAWQFVNVGTDLPTASTGTAGIVELADSAETQAGTDATLAVTPAGAAATYVPISDFSAKGVLLSASAANTQVALPVGTDGQILTADSSAATGLSWESLNQDFVPDSTFTAAGEIITGTGVGTYVALAVGTDGQYLVANSGQTGGLEWVTPDFLAPALFTAKGSLLTASAAGTVAELVAGSDGDILTADSAAASGLAWVAAPAPAIPCSLLTAKGDIVAASAANTPAALPVGADGEFLVADSSAASGLAWAASAVAPATPTVEGIVLGCTDATNTALGCNALAVNVGGANVAIGASAMEQNTTGGANVAVGCLALCSNDGGGSNVAVGPRALQANTFGDFNVAVGRLALQQSVTGSNNTAIGYSAGCNITTGSCNVAIGYGTTVDSPIGDCQLAIGFAPNQNWITGDCDKNIQPGAGIIDCTGSTGTSGQVLCTTGSALQWATPSGGGGSGIELIGQVYAGCCEAVTMGPFQFQYNSCGLLQQFLFRRAPGASSICIASSNTTGYPGGTIVPGIRTTPFTLNETNFCRFANSGAMFGICGRLQIDGSYQTAIFRVGAPTFPGNTYCFVGIVGYGSGTICGYACNLMTLYCIG